jgi:putative Mn2+ efflux pump MntP
MVALVVVALALGLNNFGAAIAIGVSGVDRLTGLKVAAVFGLWDVVMPAAGLLIGHGLAGELGRRPVDRRGRARRDCGLGTRRGSAR